nr:MAG TPA: hypothetical protein [Bacteriophage sp.]
MFGNLITIIRICKYKAERSYHYRYSRSKDSSKTRY